MKRISFIQALVALSILYCIQYHVQHPLVPEPSEVMKSLFSICLSPRSLSAVVRTISATLLSVVISLLVALPLGILIGRDANLYRASLPFLHFFRSLPPATLFPLCILTLGIGPLSCFAVSIFGVASVTTYLLAHAMHSRSRARETFYRDLGAGSLFLFVHVQLYELLPTLVYSVMNGLSLALVLTIVAEMFLGGVSGIGKEIIDAHTSYRISDMYALIVLSGSLGYSLNSITERLSRQPLTKGTHR